MKRKTICICLILVAILVSCKGKGDFVEYINEENKTRHIIIDTDPGADDASAIILAAKDKDIDIVGITTLAGNTTIEQSAKNALMALEHAGRIVPVHKGADRNLNGEYKGDISVFGKDGMGDLGLINPKGVVEEKDAIDFIIESVKKYPNEIEIISLGPATNIALAIKKDPETMKKVKMIWSIGTAGFGRGNATPVAEFNVYADALAYKTMLDLNVPITVIGFDICLREALWTSKDFEALSNSGSIGEFVTKSFKVFREIVANDVTREDIDNCDSFAMMCALYPDIIKKSVMCHASCIADAGETHGQVIFYEKGKWYEAVREELNYNVRVVTAVDGIHFFKNYLHKISR